MHPYTFCVVICLLLFIGIPAAGLYGHRVGRRWLGTGEANSDLNTGTVDAAILSLLGLLTAFTFSNTYSRYEIRRGLIVAEVNAIGTAHLRLDLVPQERQSKLRELFREYVRSRYEFWLALFTSETALSAQAKSEELQDAIWTNAVEATSNETGGDARKLLIPALNEMIDITTTRMIAIQAHPPIIIFYMLGLLALAAAWIVGYGMSKSERPSLTHIIGFAAMTTMALYLIVDIEFPRHGLVTLDQPHQLFLGLEKKM